MTDPLTIEKGQVWERFQYSEVISGVTILAVGDTHVFAKGGVEWSQLIDEFKRNWYLSRHQSGADIDARQYVYGMGVYPGKMLNREWWCYRYAKWVDGVVVNINEPEQTLWREPKESNDD